jgi:PAS domain S-box-containing protein
VGVISLIGWISGISVLKSGIPNLQPMVANTAVALIALSSAAYLLTLGRRRARALAALLGFFVAVLGAANLVEIVTDVGLRIDRLLFANIARQGAAIHPGRMAFLTAIVFILTGLGALLEAVRAYQRTFALFLTAAVMIVTFVLLAYLYGFEKFYDIAHYTPMALTTAVAFLFLCIALLAGSEQAQWTHLFFVRGSHAGTIVRWLTPALLIVTVVAGWLRVVAENRGYVDGRGGLALLTVFTVTTCLGVVIFLGELLRRHELIQEEKGRQLAESEERARATFDFAGVGIVHTSPSDGRLLRVNPKLCHMLGYTEEELMRRTFTEITPLTHIKMSADAMQQLTSGSSDHVDFEKQYIRNDGTLIDAQVTSTLVGKPGHENSYFLTFIQDVTAERAAKAALRQSEETASDGIFLNAADGRFLDVNRAGCAMLGYSKLELIQTMCLQDFVPPEDLPSNPLRFKALKPGEQIVFTRRVLRKDRSALHVELNVKMRPDSTIQTFMRDVTERRIAEELLRHSEEKLRALIENLSDIVAIVDAQGTVVYESPSSERLLGFRREELIGTSAFDRIHPDDRTMVLDLFRSGINEPGATNRSEYRMLHRDGTYRTFEAIGLNMLHHPAVRGIVVTARDVTERKHIQTQLEQASRMSSLGHLAATVAHEFNNVLMGIQPFAEVVKRSASTSAQLTTASDHIQNSIRRGRRITQEILRFTQPQEPVRASINLHRWLTELDPEIRSLLGERHELRTTVAPDTVVYGDAAQLSQVITNLVLNARDAMAGSSGTLTITACRLSSVSCFVSTVVSHPEHQVCICVSDTGSGISGESLPHVFDPLFTTKRSGTGLGLAVARQIIEKHGGSIFVESAEGKGAKFYIILPCSGETVASTSERPIGSAERRIPRKVLLVEDDELVAAGISALLGGGSFEVKVACRGGDVRHALNDFKADVMVLDVGLPDVDGIDLYCSLEDAYPDLAVIFSTGHGDRSRIDALLRKPNVGFLQKPYDFGALTNLIERLTSAPAAWN